MQPSLAKRPLSKNELVGYACRKCGDIFAKKASWRAQRGHVCGPCDNKRTLINVAKYRASKHGQAKIEAYRVKNAQAIYSGARSRKEVNIDTVNALKAKPCADCKNTYRPHQMDFDHVRGEKTFNVGTAVHQSYPMDEILDEIKKCDLVCSNCHRDRTYNRAEQRRLARLN